MDDKVVRDGALEAKADELYAFIWDYLREHARPPSQREMYRALGVSPNTLHKVLRLLKEQGRAIQRVAKHRGMRRGVWPRRVIA